MVVVERHGQQAARSMAAGKFVQVTCNSNAEGNPIVGRAGVFVQHLSSFIAGY